MGSERRCYSLVFPLLLTLTQCLYSSAGPSFSSFPLEIMLSCGFRVLRCFPRPAPLVSQRSPPDEITRLRAGAAGGCTHSSGPLAGRN